MGLALSFGRGLNDLGQPDCELGAFPDQIRPGTSYIGGFAGPFQALEQDFHVLAEQPLPEPGVHPGSDQFVLRHGYKFTHDKGLATPKADRIVNLFTG
jgi:hypothetical protein